MSSFSIGKEFTQKVLVILWSSRKESNSLKAVTALSPFSEYDVLDLRNFSLGYYEYEREKNANDDFHLVVEKMDVAQVIIFATPVYWYSMSGRMKVLVDRFTELLSTYKDVGKRLKGKRCYVISCGSDAVLPEGFEVPFRLTAKYFDMEYCGAFYLRI